MILPLFLIEALIKKNNDKNLLADDIEIVRALMHYVLEKMGGIEVLALASNGQKT